MELLGIIITAVVALVVGLIPFFIQKYKRSTIPASRVSEGLPLRLNEISVILNKLKRNVDNLWINITGEELDKFKNNLEEARTFLQNNKVLIQKSLIDELDHSLKVNFTTFGANKNILKRYDEMKFRNIPLTQNDIIKIRDYINQNRYIKNIINDQVDRIENDIRRRLGTE